MYIVRLATQEQPRCSFSHREDAEAQVLLFIQTEGAGEDSYVIEEVQDPLPPQEEA